MVIMSPHTTFFRVIAHRNPGMRHRVESIEGVFHRAFWSFGQCIDAFRHCRPVLSIDGTFLTKKYKATFILQIVELSNENMLPVAFALVPSEHDDNWECFMGNVRLKVFGPIREVWFMDHIISPSWDSQSNRS